MFDTKCTTNTTRVGLAEVLAEKADPESLVTAIPDEEPSPENQ